MSEKDARRPGTLNVPIRMSPELDAAIAEAAAQVGLSKQDTMRLSIERGLTILVAQLTNPPTDKIAA